jgi:hypothetical protein
VHDIDNEEDLIDDIMLREPERSLVDFCQGLIVAVDGNGINAMVYDQSGMMKLHSLAWRDISAYRRESSRGFV